MARKYPKAPFDWCWQYVFPAEERSREPRSGQWMRHHIYERSIQRAFREAIYAAGITKPARCHSLRPFLRNPSADGRL